MIDNFKSLESAGNVEPELRSRLTDSSHTPSRLEQLALEVGKSIKWFHNHTDANLTQFVLHHVELADDKVDSRTEKAVSAFRKAAETWAKEQKLDKASTDTLVELGNDFLSGNWGDFVQAINEIPKDKYDKIVKGFTEIIASANKSAPTKVTVEDHVFTFHADSGKIVINCARLEQSMLDREGKQVLDPKIRKEAIQKFKEKMVNDFSTISDGSTDALSPTKRITKPKSGSGTESKPEPKKDSGPRPRDWLKERAVDMKTREEKIEWLTAHLINAKPEHDRKGRKVVHLSRGYDESIVDAVAERLKDQYRVTQGFSDAGLSSIIAVPKPKK